MSFDQNKPANNAPLVSADVRNNLVHIMQAISKEHGWNDADPAKSSHRLDQINAIVSGSTQRDVVAGSDYTTGSGNIGVLYNHTIQGITASTYNLQGLLQELVNRSHRHVIENRLYNCNCNCNCDGGSCFPAGTLVFMADLTWKAIELVKPGENVMGLNGPNPVLDILHTKLGMRRSMWEIPGELFITGEHPMWIKTPEGKETFGTHDYNQYQREKKYATYQVQGKDVKYVGLANSEPYVITESVQYAHMTGWLERQPIIARQFVDADFPVYNLIVGGSHTFIANGYVVSGELRDDDYNYENIKWEGIE